MTTFTRAWLCALAVAICGCRADPEPPPGAGAATPVARGIDRASIDTSVAPGDDFYKCANGAWLKGTEIPGDRTSFGDREFFLSYAQAWKTKLREPLARQLVVTDGHALDEYRADTVRNLDAWYPAFDVKPGQKLYLEPSDRVRVW